MDDSRDDGSSVIVNYPDGRMKPRYYRGTILNHVHDDTFRVYFEDGIADVPLRLSERGINWSIPGTGDWGHAAEARRAYYKRIGVRYHK